MTAKDKILELFEQNKGVYFSGEEIAQKLSVSRAAIWKAVKLLQKNGYRIDAVNNKGYCLAEDTDILSTQGIQKYLKSEQGLLRVVVIPKTTSTNIAVREKAEEGETEGYVLIANEQEGGKGRRGRKFYSPEGTGLYMSLLLRPTNYPSEQAVRITTMAAVAVCEAIEEVSPKKAMIKWVNDIFMEDKKVCGILTEASFGMESGLLEYAVLGIGINVYQPQDGFTGDLQQIAGSVFDKPRNDMKNQLAAAVINHFMNYYKTLDRTDYSKEYRKRSLAIGRKVKVLSGDTTRMAQVLDLDDDCHLLVQYEDGSRESLSSGEISIRL